jgi:hypothetical protein
MFLRRVRILQRFEVDALAAMEYPRGSILSVRVAEYLY